MPRRLAVIHHPRSQRPEELFKAIGDAAELLWVVVDGEDGGRIRRVLLERLGPVVEISSTDLDGAATKLREAGTDGVVTFVDVLVPVVAELALRLGLPGTSVESAAGLTDKFLQRQALEQAGVPQPRFWRLQAGLSPEQLSEIGTTVTYPAVIKPTHGAGSAGVQRLDSASDLSSAYQPDIEQLIEEYMPDRDVQNQSFGSYVSVESVVSGETISHAAVSGRFPLNEGFRENGIFIPAALEPAEEADVLRVATRAIRALGVTNSCLHIEIKLTPDGPKIIEVNGRVGGGPPAVLASVSDVHLFRLAAEIALGRAVRFETVVPCSAIGYWWDVNPPMDATEVLAIHGTLELSESPLVDRVDIRCPPGTVLDTSLGTIGVICVRGRASTLEELTKVTGLINSTITIDYQRAEPVSFRDASS